MRFSLLSLNLCGGGCVPSDTAARIARFVAEQNTTCLCLQRCSQCAGGDPVAEDESVRVGNPVHGIHEVLESHGLKYRYVWNWSCRSVDGTETGAAVLSQLPILGSASRFVSDETQTADCMGSSRAVMASLAIAPDVTIDVFSVELSPAGEALPGQVDELLRFAAEPPQANDSTRPSRQPRRGPGRGTQAPPPKPAGMRLVCLAGSFDDVREGHALRRVAAAGYAEPTASLRAAGHTATGLDGRWMDYVFLKPAIRPRQTRMLFTGSDEPAIGERFGISVEIEV